MRLMRVLIIRTFPISLKREAELSGGAFVLDNLENGMLSPQCFSRSPLFYENIADKIIAMGKRYIIVPNLFQKILIAN